MAKRSAGLLLFRRRPALEVLLAHPGGPYWARKDLGSWSIPKGEFTGDEEPLAAALREFAEETGGAPPDARTYALGEALQPSRKLVVAFAREGEFDPATLRSNLVEIAWPPRSGRRRSVPEIDRVAWFGPEEARARILPGQRPFIERLEAILAGA